jgi:hypothetical protein
MLTLLLALFPKLAKLTKLFYLCRCLFVLCFSLVFFFLLFGVGFKLSLIPLWSCFIGFLEPSKKRSNKFFTYPLTKLFKI